MISYVPMTSQPNNPTPNGPEMYAVDSQKFWRSHAAGIQAAQILMTPCESPEFVAYALTSEAVISELKSDNAQLRGDWKSSERLSVTDPLTGLLNRRGLEDIYESFSHKTNKHTGTDRREKSNHMLFLDLDNFKHINDSEGHIAGDKRLQTIAEIMRASSRLQDIKARYGGDELLLILLDVTPDRADKAANTIREKVKELTKSTVSIGIGRIEYGTTLWETVKKADDALLAAKRSGKDVVVNFDEL